MKKIRLRVTLIGLSFIFLLSGCTGSVDNKEEMFDINAWDKGVAQICSNENDGYYVFSGDFLYTIENGLAMALCNKADCSHEEKECNAYLKKVQGQTIWYDGTSIFVVAYGGSGRYSVYKINKDGSGSKKVCDLFQTTGIAGFSLFCYFRSDYLYYVLELSTAKEISKDAYSQKLYRIRLSENADPELLYENTDGIEEVSTAIGRCYFYNNDIYMPIRKFNSNGGMSNALYRYSTEKDKMELFLDRYVSNYFITNNVLYYTGEEGIYKYSLDGKEDTLFYENPAFCGGMRFDGEYIYVDDSWYQLNLPEHSENVNICVLDLDGTLLKEVSTEWRCTPIYGDGKDAVVQGSYVSNTDDGIWSVDQFYFYDKDQIVTDQDEWSCIEIKQLSDLE